MAGSFESWVDEAAVLPVAFAQVREDPLVDQWVVNQIAGNANVMMIASGGCTAALLATSAKVARLHLVDPNPAQMALTRLKLRLLQTANLPTRLALLGHTPMPVSERQERLKAELANLGLPENSLGPTAEVAQLGPDQAGRYERVFAALRNALVDSKTELEELLKLDNPAEQGSRVLPTTTLGRQLDEALDTVMALPNLVRLFGEEATKNPVEPFSRHFARRLRHVLATLPAISNPYLWQMLLGRYPESRVAPWLTEPQPSRLPDLTFSIRFMDDALAEETAAFDFVHLSNILDWLPKKKAESILDLAWRALRPGGWLIIRQLNSVLEIPNLGPQFNWLSSEANALHTGDRSFFYRALHLGRKQ